MCCSNGTKAVVLTLLFGLCTWQNAQAQTSGAYFYEPTQHLFIWTGNSGHDVVVSELFGFVIISIDNEYYPVYDGEAGAKFVDVKNLSVDTGNGDDTVDISIFNDTDSPELGFVDIYVHDGDDYVDGPSTDEVAWTHTVATETMTHSSLTVMTSCGFGKTSKTLYRDPLRAAARQNCAAAAFFFLFGVLKCTHRVTKVSHLSNCW